ncbi:hypothetical protein [Paraburkholderia sp. J63]|uniref:hypothetical protein n=1 Tax=Paraburkholderia sp. J63 TaxID=2805434 RepID=UPI002ABE8236|nr:hypothetical protein [Paraburkholderia sp. J63]
MAIGAPPSAALAGCAIPHVPIAHTSVAARRHIALRNTRDGVENRVESEAEEAEDVLRAPGVPDATDATVDVCGYKIALPLTRSRVPPRGARAMRLAATGGVDGERLAALQCNTAVRRAMAVSERPLVCLRRMTFGS